MPNSKINISFNIDAWTANSFGLSEPNEWKQWATEIKWPEDGKINVANIPAMMRRRMSPLSKLAVQTAIEMLNQHQVDYLVFSSRHGELHRSVALVEDIINGEEASPMAFSQSVHNTAAGLATIATKQPIPLTSIAAAENTFQSAILEAWLFLSDNPDKKVLLVDFDEPMPDSYLEYENQQYKGFGLGLILSHGDGFTVQSSINAERSGHPLPQGLVFLQQYLLDKSQWTIFAPQQAWEWHKK
ncbi:beta-ketoacyl synthase chain length factor [Vibrio alginolyticus]|uniref:beta-ketoacyl synthase chain length factor n=1 Tax=Vibrio alginolyticus TaxID=663 RepID=UPI00215DE3FA|nr:beta-ketoacyl synthase chain length factor [Vibrio alginolyticus]MCS0110021.1 beta-ketoacyl synthase chain length factor [Vibrio alginolyticus]